ncbi:hypothetical protein E2C01_038741 [Portunus trituberculatus]|uniref:Uncharacterized protein n=1 Tax=Portunus trituberculatus TaxID=210409 RepID=A0A5B7FHY1_PORTR|nr:hypothetical protein [Portunus trituberculatus]
MGARGGLGSGGLEGSGGSGGSLEVMAFHRALGCDLGSPLGWLLVTPTAPAHYTPANSLSSF